MDNRKGTILLVEDHRELAETVGAYLEASEFVVDYASDGAQGLLLGSTEDYDVIVLDLMLPKLDGLTVCQRLRAEYRKDTPIIMLTARDQLDDKLKGFESGADDYLVKPFDMPELEARIDALTRRAQGHTTRHQVGDLTLDTETLQVTRAGQDIRLSKTLFELLKILMRESPKVVSRATLEQDVWGDDLPDSDTLRSHMYNLRRAVDRPFDGGYIETLPGQGYRVRAPVA